MSVQSFHEYVMNDVLGSVPGVTSRRMFGGYGLYLDSRIFGLITSDEVLYFKVGESNRAQFEAADSKPFVYTGHATKGPTTMPYWTVPEEVLSDANRVAEWVEQSAQLSEKKS